MDTSQIEQTLDVIHNKNPDLLVRNIRLIVTDNYGSFDSKQNQYQSSDLLSYNKELFTKIVYDTDTLDKLNQLINNCKFCCNRTKLSMAYCGLCNQYNIGGQIINDWNRISIYLNSVTLPQPVFGSRSIFQKI